MRWRGLPVGLRAALVLGRRERVLAWASSPPGALVATSWRLHLPCGVSFGWDELDRVSWAGGQAVIVPSGGGPALRCAVPDPGHLPEVIQAAVGQAVVFSRRVQLGYGVSASLGGRVVCRRSPRTGQARWEVVLDPGVDLADPAVRARADAAVREARADLGVG